MKKLVFWPWYYVATPAINLCLEKTLDILFGVPDDLDVEGILAQTFPRTTNPHPIPEPNGA